MSVKAVAWVLDDLQGLKPGPTLVMLALADFADERNSCFPGQSTIAARARCSKRSVVTYLKELEELGLITVESRFFSNGGSSIRRSSNRYVLHVGRSFGLDDAKSAHSRKTPVQNECADFSHSTLESANSPLSKVQQVALIEPPVIEPTSPLPPVNVSGGGLSGVGEEDFSPMDGDRLGAGAPADGEFRFGFAFDAVAQRPDGEGAFPTSSVSGLGADRRLCDEVVPPGLVSGLSGHDVSRVSARVRELLAAGWSRERLRECVARRPLPERVFSPVGLVLSRLRDDVSACGDSTSEVASGFEWRTAAGRRVKRYEVDWSRVLAVHRRALAAGETVTEHRAEFLWELTGGVVDDFLI
ncbi:DNA binding protein with helix-turn-helix domain (plasmid) [Corynebacterium mustelae]|uniref:DNA binding protein with helix-turn-helix domain n=1 Tax=Corynebacterium mustelae TaxID=571915 RepID=A0A0G3H8D3_9CORY|nr:helix-turn-helix domain-containing protein [Corynebacterium mustelae]AKK07407.1 DNA binding protein with helix-turn-helix domain [Corynebacterium mustelae]